MDNTTMNGALEGAKAGSAAGPWGAIIGAVVGAKKANSQQEQQQMADSISGLGNGSPLRMDDRDRAYAMNLSNAGYGGY